MRKPRSRKINMYLTASVFDDTESVHCPFLMEDSFVKENFNGGEQNWLTYRELKNLQYFVNSSVDYLETQYAKKKSK